MTQKNIVEISNNKKLAGKKRLFGTIIFSVILLGVCVTIRYYWQAEPASAAPVKNKREAESSKSPATSKEQASAEKAKSDESAVPEIVATVNMQRITRKELALQCRIRYGEEVLESMVNKYLIVSECQRQGITVTNEEVNAEINRMASRFDIPVDQWLKMLKQERNISPAQYANDIIWPTLALRKLAGNRLAVTEEELKTEFDIQYGEAVRARLIAVSSLEKAKKIHALAVANPDDFGNLAKEHSEDAVSASAKGVINPIRRHGSYKEIEDAVFKMADGEITPVIHAGGQYVIIKREGLIPARPVSFEKAAPRLEEAIRDRKMRTVAQEVFRKLQDAAKIENVWNDPQRSQELPGVAALVNGHKITIQELDEACMARHGQQTLEAMIGRSLLEQACRKRNIKVTEEDMEKEIARAALAGVKPNPDGTPNVKAWLDMVVKQQGIPLELYRSDVIWPTAALKKLAGDNVKVTEEDLRKGFEANYGPRVRCLAIVLNNQRQAHQVFELARKNNTSENFAELAARYSVDASSQALRGEIPPIKRYGGQPQLEEEAFSLKPGEISGVIQVGEKFVILRCEGYTKPVNVDFATVRQDIYDDIYEKKLRIAMAEYFEKLWDSATIDNYLAGTSHTPAAKRADADSPEQLPALRQMPGG